MKTNLVISTFLLVLCMCTFINSMESTEVENSKNYKKRNIEISSGDSSDSNDEVKKLSNHNKKSRIDDRDTQTGYINYNSQPSDWNEKMFYGARYCFSFFLGGTLGATLGPGIIIGGLAGVTLNYLGEHVETPDIIYRTETGEWGIK